MNLKNILLGSIMAGSLMGCGYRGERTLYFERNADCSFELIQEDIAFVVDNYRIEYHCKNGTDIVISNNRSFSEGHIKLDDTYVNIEALE